VLELQLLGF